MERVERQFPANAAAPKAARAFMRSSFSTWQLDASSAITELLVSEVVTNVVVHVGSTMTVRASHRGSIVRVEVDDTSNEMPVVRDGRPDAERHRGLPIVAAFASAWGSQLRPGGKTVWFEVNTGNHRGTLL
jgi:hypothetical protein